ncbi:AraC family transcriptional regulator [Elizabethkingia anophelis]|nr:AraC family transcriptional regulator [Elizabethkingia anophelis]MDV3842076.1 AraC family transcriptional regulator [Elizabethkingia anophelis]
MKEIKKISLQELSYDSEDLLLQKDYIYIPDFKVTQNLTEPYRSEYYCIGYIMEGELVLQSNLVHHHLKAPCILLADPTAIKCWEIPESPYKAKSILISETFLQGKLIENNILTVFSDISSYGVFSTSINENISDQINSFYKILDFYTQPIMYFHKEIIHGIVYSMLNIIINLHDIIGHRTFNAMSNYSLTFRKLVSQYGVKERGLGFYANLLNIHPKYLSKLVQKETGRTGSEWIQMYIILEAKIMLQKKDLSIKDISEFFNFPDQSTFSKYFKKYSNYTPNQYRQSLQR